MATAREKRTAARLAKRGIVYQPAPPLTSSQISKIEESKRTGTKEVDLFEGTRQAPAQVTQPPIDLRDAAIGETRFAPPEQETIIKQALAKQPVTQPTPFTGPNPLVNQTGPASAIDLLMQERERALEQQPFLTGLLEATAVGGVQILGALATGSAIGSLLGGATKVAATSQIGKPAVTAQKGSLIGRTIDVDAVAKQLGLTKAQTAAVAKELGRRRVSEATNIAISGRFPINSKTLALTTSLGKKIFTTVRSPAFIIGAIGSYPFAGFIKEEALQTLSIPIMKAIDAGDLETAAAQTAEVDAMLADSGSLLDKIPFANVVSQLIKFFEASGRSNDAWKQIIAAKARQAQEPSFAEERETADETAREREISQRGEDTEFFEAQREESRQTELEQRARDAEYFGLIREGKYEEAKELLDAELK